MFEPFIAGRIDEKLITAHWNDVLHFVTSIRTGAASASLLLKRLGAYSRQNSLALTLRKIERIKRTLLCSTGWSYRDSAGRQPRSSIRARRTTPLLAQFAFTASAACAILQPRCSTTVRAGSRSSLPRSCSVTPCISARALDELHGSGHRSVHELKAAIDAFIQAHNI